MPVCLQLCGYDTGDGVEVGDLTGTSYNSSESTLKDLRDLTLGDPTLDEELGLTMATTAGVGVTQQTQSLQHELNSLRNLPSVTWDQVSRIEMAGVGGWGGGG